MLLVCFFFAKTTFTTVTGNKLTSAAEMVDGKTTVIGAALAFGHGCVDIPESLISSMESMVVPSQST